MMSPPRYSTLGDQAIVVHFGETIEPETFHCIGALARAIERAKPLGWIESVPAFTSLTLFCDPLLTTAARLTAVVELIVEASQAEHEYAPRVIEIPVCYGGEYGVDLDFVAQHHRLSADEVITLHANVDYLVHMIGFMPGFPYLGGLSSRLATPRRATPRLNVLAGSVGIGGSQTGIYSLASPGGWQIIGRTPLRLFSADREPPVMLSSGDIVRFQSITSEQFRGLAEGEA